MRITHLFAYTFLCSCHQAIYLSAQVQLDRTMLARLLAFSLLLLTTSAFAQLQPPLHAEEAIATNRTLRTGRVALGGEGRERHTELGATDVQAAGTRFRYTIAGDPSERRLVTPITDSASLRNATRAWCNDSQTAAEKYGDISSWYVKI